MKWVQAVVLLGIGLSLAACGSQTTLCDSVRDFPQTDCSGLRAFYKATDEPNRKDHRAN